HLTISLTYHANISFNFHLQSYEYQIRQWIEVLRLSYLLGRDFYSGTLGEPLGDFCSLLRGNRRQVTGDTTGSSASKGCPGGEDHALGGIAWGNADASGLRGGRLGFIDVELV